jgi:hypothetical protein
MFVNLFLMLPGFLVVLGAPMCEPETPMVVAASVVGFVWAVFFGLRCVSAGYDMQAWLIEHGKYEHEGR